MGAVNGAGAEPSSESSLSPDEGVNTTTHSGSSAQSSDGSAVGDLAVGVGVGNNKQASAAAGVMGGGSPSISQESSSVSPTTRSSVDSEGTTVELAGVGGGAGSGDLPADGAPVAQRVAKLPIDQAALKPSAPTPRRFQLKSLLKFGGKDGRSATAERKAAEHRRQSGSHFIEQLMSKYQQEQQMANSKPLDQMLSCDTTGDKSAANYLSVCRSVCLSQFLHQY